MSYVSAPRRPRRSNRTILSETAAARSNRAGSPSPRPSAASRDARMCGPGRPTDRSRGGPHIVTQPPPPPGWVPPRRPPPAGPRPCPGWHRPRPARATGTATDRRCTSPGWWPCGPRSRRLLRRRLQDHPAQPPRDGGARGAGDHGVHGGPGPGDPVLAAAGHLGIDLGLDPSSEDFGTFDAGAVIPRELPRDVLRPASPRWCSTACWSGWSRRRSSDDVRRRVRRGPRPAVGWSR